MASLLEARGVVAGYGRGPAILDGAELSVEAGEVLCLIGPNGAGKSTLLKVISGLLPARRGEVLLDGRSILGLRPNEVLARGICFVPQERALFPAMSVRENLRMGGYLIADRAELNARIEEVMATFPVLRERGAQRAGALSGGEQQMLALGRALIMRPRIVMLDEPSLGLAPSVVRQMFDIVAMFKDRGMTVIVVEQNAVIGLRHADRGCVLDLGRTLFAGPAASVLGDPRIRELYLGRRVQVS